MIIIMIIINHVGRDTVLPDRWTGINKILFPILTEVLHDTFAFMVITCITNKCTWANEKKSTEVIEQDQQKLFSTLLKANFV